MAQGAGTKPRVRRIAVLVETSTSWGSVIIAGISDFAKRLQSETGERWTLYVDSRGYFERQELPAWWKGDGVIARVTTPLLVQQVRLASIPCVNVSQIRIPGADIQQVTSNQTQIGRLSAETLIRTGVKHFGYFGPPKREFYKDEILPTFTQTLREAGFGPPAVFDPDRTLRSDSSPHDMLQPLVEWLATIPRPAGILSWSFHGGQRVCEACCFAGIDVPREISVLSADYDQLISDICDPPLTCIDQSARQVGYIAAAELHRILDGGTVDEPRIINSAGIVWKKSVITEHVDDELVSTVIRHVEANVSRGISVEELCELVSVSRRKLEQHFQRTLGHGPVAHIQRVRLREACRLLAESDLLIKQIAVKFGFRNSEQFQRLLKSETGMTPVQYREFHRRPQRGTLSPAVVALDPGQVGAVVERLSVFTRTTPQAVDGRYLLDGTV